MTFVPPEQFNLAAWVLGARIAEGRGERVALHLPDRSLTYREVQRLADRFANVLVGLGVRPEERVFVALPDGAEWVGALFGILQAGGVAVPVNPELPPTAAEWALLALVGAASIAAQLAMTYAYRWVTNLQAGALAQVTVVVTMALGVLFLGDTFGPSQLVGALLALAGIVGVVWLQSAPRAVE